MNVDHLIPVDVEKWVKIVLGVAIAAFVLIIGSCSYLMAAIILN